MYKPWRPTEFQITCAALVNGAPEGELSGLVGARKLARMRKVKNEDVYRMAFIRAMLILTEHGYVKSRRATTGTKALIFSLTDAGRELSRLKIEVKD